jgi:hypothetical protein
MQLSDMENRILIELQQNPVSTVVPLGPPNWAALTSPQFNQGVIDFAINLGYKKLMGTMSRLELAQASFVLPVVANQFYYTFNPPPAGNPTIAKVKRIQYTPTGLNYTYEYYRGMDFVSWNDFLDVTGNLYGLQTGAASGTLPAVVSIVPGNSQLAIYPAGLLATDTITVTYAPLPTAGAAQCPTLVVSTDTPLLPEDCHEAIVQWALYILWTKARVFDMKQEAKQMYDTEIASIMSNYTQLHPGDTNGFRLDDINDYIGSF